MTRHGLTAMERWEDKVRPTFYCWLWCGSRTQDGYGNFNAYPGVPTNAHRFSYEAHVGPIPGGMEIDHLCENRRCVRPDHLELVTTLENIRRAKDRRRAAFELQEDVVSTLRLERAA